ATELEGLARDRGVTLAIHGPADVLAKTDRGNAARALRNVAGNAIRHSPSGGTVTIAMDRAGPLAEIRVTDQGPGIDPADQPHVFERFYRADPARGPDPATGRPTGSGLGLTIARELLAANQGTIDLES